MEVNLITPLFKNMEMSNEAFDGMRTQVTWLLSGVNYFVTPSVAKCIGTIIKYQKNNMK